MLCHGGYGQHLSRVHTEPAPCSGSILGIKDLRLYASRLGGIIFEQFDRLVFAAIIFNRLKFISQVDKHLTNRQPSPKY